MKVAVVTPTIGKSELKDCIDSVEKQTYKDVTHYVFVDGIEYEQEIWKLTENNNNIKFIRLDENVGKGWYGHRVYAACSFLVNADIIVYLDEDNWIEPCHVEKLVNKISEGNDWAFSLRKIYDKDGNFLCEDNCESLGKWPVYFDKSVFHIDTSSFAIKRDVAVRIGHAWYGQWGADRQFFSALKHHFPKFDCTNAHTLCYRLDGNPNSVTKEFFDNGNNINNQNYNGEFPWKSKQPLLQVGPGISVQF
jgi:glycosyltransferase involved in cell wall biosynthesis